MSSFVCAHANRFVSVDHKDLKKPLDVLRLSASHVGDAERENVDWVTKQPVLRALNAMDD
jgi:hypothetical protein